MKGVRGPSGARLFGRFCHGDDALRAHVEAHLRAEEALRPEAIFAEVVHLPQGRLGNVLCRPALRAHEIPYLGRSGRRAGRRIPITICWCRWRAGGWCCARAGWAGRSSRGSPPPTTSAGGPGHLPLPHRAAEPGRLAASAGRGARWPRALPAAGDVGRGGAVAGPLEPCRPRAARRWAGARRGPLPRRQRCAGERAAAALDRVGDGDNRLPWISDNVLNVETLRARSSRTAPTRRPSRSSTRPRRRLRAGAEGRYHPRARASPSCAPSRAGARRRGHARAAAAARRPLPARLGVALR